jgi:hypothetical protein
MWEKISKIWKIKDVRNKVLTVIGLLVIYRLCAHIPVPGVNVEGLRNFMSGQQMFQLLDVFAGGTVKNFSLIMLGVAPYITSSIIFQLLTMIVPKLEEMQKEGESGQAKINMYTRWLAVPLAFIQSFSMIKYLNNSSRDIFPADMSNFDIKRERASGWDSIYNIQSEVDRNKGKMSQDEKTESLFRQCKKMKELEPVFKDFLLSFSKFLPTFCGFAFGRAFTTALDTKNRTQIYAESVKRSTKPRLTQNRC